MTPALSKPRKTRATGLFGAPERRSDPDPLRTTAIRVRLSQTPKSYRATYLRAVSGKSIRAAVNANCVMCCGYERDAVRTCSALSCPLWPYRPYQSALEGDAR